MSQDTKFELVANYCLDPELPQHNMLGLTALVAEMTDQGVSVAELLRGTSLTPRQLSDPDLRLSHREKLAIFRRAQRLSTRPDLGLRAGSRQRLSDFGVLGYALSSCATFGDAVITGIKYLRLTGPILEQRFLIEDDAAVLQACDVLDLGPLLPTVAELWLASTLRLAQLTLEGPVPLRSLHLPYPAPAHAQAYERLFNCPVHFDAASIRLAFDTALLRRPCPNANAITSELCKRVCERLIRHYAVGATLSSQIRSTCLNNSGHMPGAEQIASRLGVSVRTLHRRLSEEGQRYQAIIDGVRHSLAAELLRNSLLPVDEIALRVGFSDGSNLRKAFRTWTGTSPADYRRRCTEDRAQLGKI